MGLILITDRLSSMRSHSLTLHTSEPPGTMVGWKVSWGKATEAQTAGFSSQTFWSSRSGIGPRVCIATRFTGAVEITSLGTTGWEPLLSPTSSQILPCIWLTWRSCENADSASVDLLGNGRVCISNKIPSDAHVGSLQPHLEWYKQPCHDAGKGEI